MISPSPTRPPAVPTAAAPGRPRPAVGALIGVLSGALALGTGELAAAFVRPVAAPAIAVGNRFIRLTPEPVKRWAIGEFGTSDKPVLLGGIYLVLAVAAAVIGVLALRRRSVGVLGVALLGAVGGYCALTAPAHRTSDVLPSVVGALAGIGALLVLLERARPAGAAVNDADRRRFMLTSLAALAVAAGSALIGRRLQRRRFDASAARAAITLPPPATPAPAQLNNYDLGKSGVPFETPAGQFYRIDTALSVPQLDPATWRLRIHGMVDRELSISYADLLARPLVERWVTLACVSNEVGGNLISTARFRGVLLADLLREAGVAAGADQLLATSSDGMTIGSPTAVVLDGRDAMLAVGMNGAPLPVAHGFPVRMVVPGLYGYVSACKWLVDLEATTFAAKAAYWVQGGWAAQGPVKLASRIDTPRSGASVAVGATVPVAGVAWDQHIGVSKVEVQVDGGDWQEARLAPVPSSDTWRQWVYLWTVPSAGAHTLTVRATDGQGRPQPTGSPDPFPAGAAGLHTVTVRSH